MINNSSETFYLFPYYKNSPIIDCRLVLFLLLFNFLFLESPETLFADTLPTTEVTGYYKVELAYRYSQNAAFSKFLHLFQLELRNSFSEHAQLITIGRITYDSIYDFEDFFTVNPVRPEFQRSPSEIAELTPQRFLSELREFYLDLNFSDVDLRLGRQIIRWGIIEGFRITDNINPLDYYEFILREVGDRYIPLWMANSTIYLKDTNIQILFIPDLTFDKPAPAGSEWEEFQIPSGTEIPDNIPKNWEWGIRVSENFHGWDSSLSYLYNWDELPAAFRGAFGNEAPLPFPTKYSRLHTFGLTTSKNIVGVVGGGEIAYIHGKNFETWVDSNGNGSLDSGDTFGIKEADYLQYGVSMDVNLSDTDITLQYSQKIIPHYDSTMMTDPLVSGASLFIRKELLNSRLNAQFSVLYNLNQNEALIRPRVDYKWTDHLKISVGADTFLGENMPDPNSEFHYIGFLKNHDRVYTELKYSF